MTSKEGLEDYLTTKLYRKEIKIIIYVVLKDLEIQKAYRGLLNQKYKI